MDTLTSKQEKCPRIWENILMTNYYLTEMTILKLENLLMKFIIDNRIPPKLVNGIVEKTASIMYQEHIDYYYIDEVATTMNVPIKQIDNIYLHGYHQYYQKPLSEMMTTIKAPPNLVEDSQKLEENIHEILKTRRPIRTKKINYNKNKT